MLPLLLLLFAIAPLQDGYLPPADPFTIINEEWETHGADFIPEALQPEPAPKPKPAPSRGGSGMGSGVEQWAGLVSQFFNASDVPAALCVMAGESGGNPNADNPRSSAAGLWQFLKSTWDNMVPSSVTGGSYSSGQVYDPVASTRAAAWLWYNVGPTQWNAYARC